MAEVVANPLGPPLLPLDRRGFKGYSSRQAPRAPYDGVAQNAPITSAPKNAKVTKLTRIPIGLP